MNLNFIDPTQIRSPYTGETVRPTTSVFNHDGKTYEQAVFSDPVTGHLIKKGIVSIKDTETGEVLQDYKSEFHSVTQQHSRD